MAAAPRAPVLAPVRAGDSWEFARKRGAAAAAPKPTPRKRHVDTGIADEFIGELLVACRAICVDQILLSEGKTSLCKGPHDERSMHDALLSHLDTNNIPHRGVPISRIVESIPPAHLSGLLVELRDSWKRYREKLHMGAHLKIHGERAMFPERYEATIERLRFQDLFDERTNVYWASLSLDAKNAMRSAFAMLDPECSRSFLVISGGMSRTEADLTVAHGGGWRQARVDVASIAKTHESEVGEFVRFVRDIWAKYQRHRVMYRIAEECTTRRIRPIIADITQALKPAPCDFDQLFSAFMESAPSLCLATQLQAVRDRDVRGVCDLMKEGAGYAPTCAMIMKSFREFDEELKKQVATATDSDENRQDMTDYFSSFVYVQALVEMSDPIKVSAGLARELEAAIADTPSMREAHELVAKLAVGLDTLHRSRASALATATTKHKAHTAEWNSSLDAYRRKYVKYFAAAWKHDITTMAVGMIETATAQRGFVPGSRESNVAVLESVASRLALASSASGAAEIKESADGFQEGARKLCRAAYQAMLRDVTTLRETVVTYDTEAREIATVADVTVKEMQHDLDAWLASYRSALERSYLHWKVRETVVIELFARWTIKRDEAVARAPVVIQELIATWDNSDSKVARLHPGDRPHLAVVLGLFAPLLCVLYACQS